MKYLNLKRVGMSIFLVWGLTLFCFGSGENDSFQIGEGEPLFEVGRVKQ
jgi:hypothetical protein